MQITNTLRNRLLAAALLALVLTALPVPAHAASKEMIELQTQVQQLLDMVQRLQSTFDTRFGVLQHLVEQTADNANQITAAVNALDKKINAQSEAANGKMDTVSGQVRQIRPGPSNPVAKHPDGSAGNCSTRHARRHTTRPTSARCGTTR